MRFVAVDGFAEFCSASEHGRAAQRPPVKGLAPFFHPRGIVVAATRVGVAHLLVRPYLLDESFSHMIETQLGLG